MFLSSDENIGLYTKTRFISRAVDPYNGVIMVKMWSNNRKSRYSQLLRAYRISCRGFESKYLNLVSHGREKISSVCSPNTNTEVTHMFLSTFLFLVKFHLDPLSFDWNTVRPPGFQMAQTSIVQTEPVVNVIIFVSMLRIAHLTKYWLKRVFGHFCKTHGV